MDTQQPKRYKILLVGDACTDVYVFGECERLSPEAPVPILRKRRKIRSAGMSLNVFQNLSNFAKSDITHVKNNPNLIKKIRFIDEKTKQQVLRYDIENDIQPQNIDGLLDKNYDVVVISDYDKGAVDASLIKLIIKSFDCKIFVDTKKRDLELFRGCTIKINEHEGKESIGGDNCDVIVTLGKKGARYMGQTYATKAVEVHDVCGAGDVFLSALVVRWLETKDMKRAIMTANRCAALSVTKPGTYHLSRAEYENLRV